MPQPSVPRVLSAPFSVAAGTWVLGGLLLWWSRGTLESILPVPLMALCFGALAWVFARGVPASPPPPGHRPWLGSLVCFLVLGALSPRLLYARDLTSHVVVNACSLLGLVLWALESLKERQTTPTPRLMVAWLVLWVLERVVVLWASPMPFIDVFTSNTVAALHLLKGVDPYGAVYPDIYQGTQDYAPGLAYWPAVLLWQTASYAVAQDIRAVFLVADVCTGAALYALLRNHGASRSTGLLGVVLWWSFPVHNFAYEQSWVDPLLLAPCAAALVAVDRQRWGWAGLALGLACATKQYAAVFAVVAGLFVWQHHGWRALARMTWPALLVCALIMGPFVLWDPQAFFTMSIQVPLTQGFRDESFSVLAWLKRYAEIPPAPWMYSAVPLAALGFVLWVWRRDRAVRLSHLVGGYALVFGATVFFGKQAFCNYHQFLLFFVLLYGLLEGLTPPAAHLSTTGATPAPSPGGAPR